MLIRPVRPPTPPIRPETLDEDWAAYQDKLAIYAADMADFLAVQVSTVEQHMDEMLKWQKRIIR
jgi:hypothetical protein